MGPMFAGIKVLQTIKKTNGLLVRGKTSGIAGNNNRRRLQANYNTYKNIE